ncbi:MAG: hypothetical protein ACOXZX_04355 [Synergistaceae bacterium]
MAIFDASKLNINFIKYRKIWLAISLVVMFLSVALLFHERLEPQR